MDIEASFKGWMRAQVVSNAYKDGTIGVFIPKIMKMPNHKTDSTEDKNSRDNTKSGNTLFSDDSPFKGTSGGVKHTNQILARPTFLTHDSSNAKVKAGSYRVPKKGTWVFVFFEEEDPQKCYWMPFSPTLFSTGIHTAGASDEVKQSASDTSKMPDLELVRIWGDGSTMGYDENTGSFIIRQASGHVFRIRAGNGVVGMEMITAGGQHLKIDDTGKQILIHANKTVKIDDTNGNKVVMDSAGILAQDKSGSKVEMKGGDMTSSSANGCSVVMAGSTMSLKAGLIKLN